MSKTNLGNHPLDSCIGSIIKVSLGVVLGVVGWSYYSECVDVQIYTADPPSVYLWNETTQQRGEEIEIKKD